MKADHFQLPLFVCLLLAPLPSISWSAVVPVVPAWLTAVISYPLVLIFGFPVVRLLNSMRLFSVGAYIFTGFAGGIMACLALTSRFSLSYFYETTMLLGALAAATFWICYRPDRRAEPNTLKIAPLPFNLAQRLKAYFPLILMLAITVHLPLARLPNKIKPSLPPDLESQGLTLDETPINWQVAGKNLIIPHAYFWYIFGKPEYDLPNYVGKKYGVARTIVAILPNIEHISEKNKKCFTEHCRELIYIDLDESPWKSDKESFYTWVKPEFDISIINDKLTRYKDKNGTRYYSYEDESGFHFTTCFGEFPIDKCIVYKRAVEGISVKYEIAEGHIGEWPEIDLRILTLIRSFISK